MRQLPLAIVPPSQPSFEGFVPGHNAAALAHLRALGAASAPVYLWGPTASGKTHLLQALGRQRQAEGDAVGWFDAAVPAPWSMSPAWSLVLVDRCEALDAAQQHAAFTLFVESAGAGPVIVAAGRVPPVDLPLREDLRTRLAWGHVFALQPLAESETRAVLRQEADRRGIFLSDEVMNHLLTRFPRDLAHLNGLLDALDRFGLAMGRRVSLPLLRKMLQEEGLPDPMTTAGDP